MVETAEEKGFSNPIRPQIHIIMASCYREVDSLPNRGICYAHPVFFFCFVCIVQCNKRLVFPFPNIGAIGSTLCFTGIQKRSVKVCLTGLHSEIRKGFHNNMPTHYIYIRCWLSKIGALTFFEIVVAHCWPSPMSNLWQVGSGDTFACLWVYSQPYIHSWRLGRQIVWSATTVGQGHKRPSPPGESNPIFQNAPNRPTIVGRTTGLALTSLGFWRAWVSGEGGKGQVGTEGMTKSSIKPFLLWTGVDYSVYSFQNMGQPQHGIDQRLPAGSNPCFRMLNEFRPAPYPVKRMIPYKDPESGF